MKASIDTSKCKGHGMCCATARDAYYEEWDGFGVVLFDGEVPAEFVAEARRGADNCPERTVVLTG